MEYETKVSDEEFVAQFEGLTLDEAEFGHAGHVRLGYLYLRRFGFAEAIARYRVGLKRFATHHGAPGKYHETITVAFLACIHRHMADEDFDGDFPKFAATNPELFDSRLLVRFYDPAQLMSDEARAVFILPERVAA